MADFKMNGLSQPTPINIRNLGLAVNAACVAIAAMLKGAPLSTEKSWWLTFGLGVGGIVANIFANMYVSPSQAEKQESVN